LSEETPITGTLYCPRCGFKFNIKSKRLMECLSCGRNVYGEYPRLEVTLANEEYKPKQKHGYICKECASKLGLSKKKSVVDVSTDSKKEA
jgi:DNA-directed RNA polymerase subunit RPC12/RpoP